MQVVGEDLHIQTHYSDTLVEIARRYGLGYEEMARANPKVDPWLPGEGTDIVIPGRHILPPGPRDGIIVNIPEHRIYYFPKAAQGPHAHRRHLSGEHRQDGLADAHGADPCGCPRKPIRPGIRRHRCARNIWPTAIRCPMESSVQDRITRWDCLRCGWPFIPGDYLIHGTNNPLAVGMAVTHGCIRMYPEDVAAIFPTVPVGTKVYLINVPLKVAFVDGDLLLEAHPPVDAQGQTIDPVLSKFEELLNEVLGTTTTAVNWDIAVDTLKTAERHSRAGGPAGGCRCAGRPRGAGRRRTVPPAPPAAAGTPPPTQIAAAGHRKAVAGSRNSYKTPLKDPILGRKRS